GSQDNPIIAAARPHFCRDSFITKDTHQLVLRLLS
ncbi:mCG1038254, partial [Mus musculus]